MRPPTPDLRAAKLDSAAHRVAEQWRLLTGGRAVRDPDRRTLLACSGGADSTALALALRASADGLVVAHIVHDLRPPDETLAERDGVREFAAQLGLDFVEGRASIRDRRGNAEALARHARYGELERMALAAGCPFVATAHHADDQLETMLMAILRGAGVRGLAGIPPRRNLGRRGIRVVRPMLGIARADAERICTVAGVGWATDPTNADISRFRAAVRAGPVAQLARLRPCGLKGAAETAANLRQAASLIADLSRAVLDRAIAVERGVAWARSDLRGTHPALVAEALRRAHARLHGGRHGDRLPGRSLRGAVAAIGDQSGEMRRFVWRETELVIDSENVTLQRTAP